MWCGHAFGTMRTPASGTTISRSMWRHYTRSHQRTHHTRRPGGRLSTSPRAKHGEYWWWYSPIITIVSMLIRTTWCCRPFLPSLLIKSTKSEPPRSKKKNLNGGLVRSNRGKLPIYRMNCMIIKQRQRYCREHRWIPLLHRYSLDYSNN